MIAVFCVERGAVRSRARGLQNGVREAVRSRVLFERRNDRARDTLPPELRRDEDALDLEGRFIDLLPRAAARRRTVLVCNDAAVKQMRQVVFGVAFFHITDEHKIVLIQSGGQAVKICVLCVNKAKLHHGNSSCYPKFIVIKSAFSAGLL